MSDSTSFASCCGEVVKHLVENVWPQERFWKSSYLQVLSAYDAPAATAAELRALYAYAMKLRGTAPAKATSKSSDVAVLRAAIKPVYEYYRDSEMAQLRREVVFRVQEALFGVEFDFTSNTLTEKTLATSLANNSSVLTAVVQALLEAFACLEPTVMPDLLFGIRGIGTGAAEAFSLRLGPWQIRDSDTLDKFQLLVPVLGGTYYRQTTGELQALNDVDNRRFNSEFTTDFFAKSQKDSGFQRLPSDLAAGGYILFNPATEEVNPLAPPTGYPYTGHSLTGLLDTNEVQDALQNRPSPAADASRRGYEFSYSYTPLFAAFTVLSDLPVTQDHPYANMSWAKVTEYRFIFWTNTTVPGTLTGQFYVCGTVDPDGTTTQVPLTRGGELNTIGKGNDSFLYVSRSLLLANIFLPSVAKGFRKNTKGSVVATTTEDFYVVGNEIKNKVEVGLTYAQLQPFLSDKERTTFRQTLSIPDDDLFVIPANALTFGAENDKLRLVFDQIKYKEVITLTTLEHTFTYEFVRRNGIARYQLLGKQQLGSVSLDYRTGWYYVDQWGTGVAAASTVLFGLGMAGYSFLKTTRELRAMVPAENEHPDRYEIDRIVALLDRPGRIQPRVNIAFAPPPDDSMQELNARDDSTAGPGLDEGPVVDRRQRRGGIIRPVVRRFASKEDKELGKVATKYAGYVYSYLRREVNERDALCFYNPPLPLDDERLQNYQHKISLRLQKIEERDGKKYVSVLLTDHRYNPPADGQMARFQDKRQAVLTYSYPNNSINQLRYEAANYFNPGSTEDYRLVIDLSDFSILAATDETIAERTAFRELMHRQLRGEFRDELWRTMLRTAYTRAQADDRWKTLLVNLGGVVGMVTPWALVIWNNLVQGQEATQAGLKAVFNNSFIESLLRSQLDLLKYPYDEHFTVNRVLLDAQGLKVRMGATTSATLVFEKNLEKQQSVSTYINVHDLAAITLSVAELQDAQFNTRLAAGSVEFNIQFAYAKPQAPERADQDVYTIVGNAVSFTLNAVPKTEGKGFDWKLAPKPTSPGNAATALAIPLVSFGKIDGANVLVVKRVDTTNLEDQERNTVAVEWE